MATTIETAPMPSSDFFKPLGLGKKLENSDYLKPNGQPNFTTHKHQRVPQLLEGLKQYGIAFHETHGSNVPPEAVMHDRNAPIPSLVICPKSEWGVSKALKLLKDLELYGKVPVSVKSGGHGYFNGASCSGIMLSLARMTKKWVADDILHLEPGCILGQTIDILAKNHKAVPHGDCFGVGAGGHFLTAGWDLILARKYGLGCQNVIGGRVALWDGSVIDVSENSHPDVLFAMRGGALAEIGVATEIRLRLIQEPPQATWRFTRISQTQLDTVVSHGTFSNALNLPRDVSVSIRFHFEPDQLEPVCSLNVVSLLSLSQTLDSLKRHLGHEVTSLVDDTTAWNKGSLLDIRMLPASDFLSFNRGMLAEMSPEALQADPCKYWKETSVLREMASSYFTSISYWVKPTCEAMFPKLFEKLKSVQHHEARKRMYVLVILGGGRMLDLQDECAMPLGKALSRFELHWDEPEDETWSRAFTNDVARIIQSEKDDGPSRPYRGDIWLKEQAHDVKLLTIFNEYDRRLS
ncbi:unnamed protein product [Clonostachys rosea f. rosea IK726]|uniref:Uncharacterized protein n=1 Tax=Clonostachys rosea f. rosea IK726 TaxID=1349383 RepID=A0ACA9UW04_BIOOC|nr:unnamed protein product [Clonostachys rosea f. rosea IK726]